MKTPSLLLALSLGLLATSCGGRGETTTAATSTAATVRTAVAPNAESINPLGVGDTAPVVALRDAVGSEVLVPSLVADGPVLLVFYRGGWCPFCMRHFADLARIQGDLESRGVRLVGISPDAPAKLAEYAETRDIPYTLYSDNTHAAAKAFGVAFSVDDATDQALRGYGIHLGEWSDTDERVLPVPAAFLLDRGGVIRYSHTDPDYRVRLSGDEILAAVDAGLGG